MNIKTVTIKGTSYNIHLDSKLEGNWNDIYRITGTRKADGALIVHPNGRMVVVGISALQKLNWFDITDAVGSLEAVAA